VLATFLKGTVSESLTKLLQPASVVPATIFVLLNLAFVYPAAQGSGVAKSFAGLDANWQVVVVATVILGLGYLLLNAANAIIDILAGQSWRNSGLNWWLRRRQLKMRNDLETRANSQDRLPLKWQLATHYPSLNPKDTIQATRLGNVLVATQHIIWRRYGIDITALWSQMESVKDLDKTPAMVAVKDDKATLDLLANLIFVLIVFGLEAMLFYSSRDRWTAALFSLVAFVASYIAYRVAVGSARSWGDGMQVVLDLHRDALRSALGLREASKGDDERQLWQGTRHVYLPGDDEPAPADLFSATPVPTLETVAATTLTVDAVSATTADGVIDETPRPPNGVIFSALLRYVDYILLVSRAPLSGYGPVDVVVSDPRLRAVREPAEPAVGRVKVKPDVSDSGVGQQLHWQIEQLLPGSSVTWAYRLPIWRLEIDGDAPRPAAEISTGGLRLTFTGGASKRMTVRVQSFAPLTTSPRLTINGEEKTMDLVDREQGAYEAGEHQLVGGDTVWLTLPAGPA
jgi:hypothetical protein